MLTIIAPTLCIKRHMHKNDHKNITYVKTIQTQRINSLQSLRLKQLVRYNDLIVYFFCCSRKKYVYQINGIKVIFLLE